MSICFVLSHIFLLFESHIAPTFSTCAVIGSSTVMFMVCNSCKMNFNSFTTSESAMVSASVVDSTTLFIHFVGFWVLPPLIPLLQCVNRWGFEVCSVNSCQSEQGILVTLI